MMTTPDPANWTLNSCFGAFRTIWVHLGPLSCLTNLGAKRSELVQKFVTRSRVGIYHDECTRSTPLDPKLMFWCVSYHLGAFGIVKLPNGTQGQTFQTSAKFRATKLRRSFSRRTHPIHPIGTKTHVLEHFVPFGTTWFPYQTRSKTFRTSAKVRATKSRRNFAQRMHPIHPIGCIWDR